MNDLIKIIKLHSTEYKIINDKLYILIDEYNFNTKEWKEVKKQVRSKKQLLNILGY